MGSRPFPEIFCVLCSNAVNLQTDLSTDENGRAVHEECYVKRIEDTKSNRPSGLMARMWVAVDRVCLRRNEGKR
jgi:hypothetical protein